MEKIEIIDGIPVKTTENVVLTKEEVLLYKAEIQQEIDNCENQLIAVKKNLDKAKDKMVACEKICTELGY